LLHRYATECPSRFVRVRGEATPGWRVDTSGWAEKSDAAWNVSGAVARRLGAQAVTKVQQSCPLRLSSISRRSISRRQQPHTRAVYWRAWRLVVTWRLGAFLLALGAVLSTSP
jgi:hypothetical protein